MKLYTTSYLILNLARIQVLVLQNRRMKMTITQKCTESQLGEVTHVHVLLFYAHCLRVHAHAVTCFVLIKLLIPEIIFSIYTTG